MTFDIDKSYSVLVWDMPVAVFDNELDDYIRNEDGTVKRHQTCLLYTSPSPRDGLLSRMPSSA